MTDSKTLCVGLGMLKAVRDHSWRQLPVVLPGWQDTTTVARLAWQVAGVKGDTQLLFNAARTNTRSERREASET